MTAVTSPSPTEIAPEGVRKKAFRPDIQGLRMVAVVAVIADHLFHWPGGGFVGVDVFFVISGFLITGLLLREHQRTGRISFADFYRRRARRILPVSTLVLGTTVAASFAIYFVSRATTVAWDAFWSLLFSANWRFAAIGTDYWAQDGTVSPLQHYWSLAVEEQFYFVWPLLLVGVLMVGAARSWGERARTRSILAALAIVVGLSFAWAVWESTTNPGFAYFSTFSRAWELGIGSVLAVLAPALRRIPQTLRPTLAWAGLLAIVASLFLVSGDDGFPAPWAALPVLATALVIAAGTGSDRPGPAPLTNRVAGYLGDISFSLYLWHFPVIILTGAVLPAGPGFYLSALLLTGVLSVLSYHLVEEPVRRSNWLQGGWRFTARRHDHRRDRADVRASRSDRLDQLTRTDPTDRLVLAVAVVVVGACLAYAAIPRGETSTAAAAPSQVPVGGVEGATDASPLAVQINESLQAEAFPELVPGVDALGTASWLKQVAAEDCADIGAWNVDRCQTGPADAEKHVAVLGDSFGIAWMPGIRAALESDGYRIHPFTMGQCPSASVEVTKEGGEDFGECSEHREWAITAINALSPDLIVLADSAGTLNRLSSGADVADGVEEIAEGLTSTIGQLSGAGGEIVVLSPPPTGVALQECVTRVGQPSDCTRSISDSWYTFSTRMRDASVTSSARYEDTSGWFCNEDGYCPGFVGTTPVRADQAHLTVEYSRSLAPLLRAALQPSAA